ncbi:AAA family ATPase [Floccifex sp.]|uniref:AAA family ATPase n=1 Tax=Floccifex sp. TaxID=2815810 RepID=UPI002A75BFFB|nr:AAA family ATPase [Floccifex sp.]MDY2957832.1 AAA family ATPase [Floccifex sp.]
MKKLPIGIENFKELIDNNYYFVDKTLFIKDVFNEKLALYTRPRRFGKTLNMSMLYYFFSNKEKENSYLFDGLDISKDKEIMKYQNKYPVILISLKDMKNKTFDNQLSMFSYLISMFLKNNTELLNSDILNESDKSTLIKYENGTATEIELQNALNYLTYCLEKHYQSKVIILIDEYDVPLQSAYENGYYEDMVDFLRSVFSSSLKTNSSLEKGILTGCLRISKESIFTGLNNFKSFSILDIKSSQRFGFTHEEVKNLLDYYGLGQYIQEVKEWYDGYLFGDTEIYTPWSTLMYVDRKLQKDSLQPISFWSNTSGNDIVVNYIKQSDQTLHDEFELLMQGKTLKKKINPELTYRDMDNIHNIYSFLLMTGYLKVHKEIVPNEVYELIIPNKEVYKIYEKSFMDYFSEIQFQYKNQLIALLNDEKVEKAQSMLNDILEKSISYYDNYESFYHGFLLGLFQGLEVSSNKESGNGRFDIEILPRRLDETVLIIECKHSKTLDDLIDDSKKASKQIIDKRYLSNIKYKKYNKVIGYGISFFKKQCFITKANDSNNVV